MNKYELSGVYPETTGETVHYMQVGAQQGWQCPICKRVLSPWTPECPCKGQGPQTWTTTSITLKGTGSETATLHNESGVDARDMGAFRYLIN